MLTLGVVLALGLQSSAQGADPANGTWELNVQKSTWSPGPPPKSQTPTFEITGQSVKSTHKGIDASGKPTLFQYTANYDGKDYPTTGSPYSDSISFKRIDSSVEFTQKRAGKIVSTGTRVISKDGKVMTVTFKGTDAKGQTTSGMMVFEKR